LTKIAPSILSADFARLGEEVAAAEAAGADYIHIDVMDGHFVPQITVGPLVVESLRPKTALPLDVHLMIKRPEVHLGAFVEAGANIVTVHQEACPNLHRVLETIKRLGARAGVSLNPLTPLTAIEEAIPYLDLLLIMTVEPGYGGQEFIPGMVDKTRRAKTLIERANPDCELEVDGGIDSKTAPMIVAGGAQVLVAGYAIFQHPEGVKAAIKQLRESIKKASTREAP
jgi:ribulose-phosphate 3-epimerase